MRKIKSVGVVVSGPEGGFEWYSIGREINGLKIFSIRNVGSEFENSIHSQYCFYDESGGGVLCIENCPVIVEYEEV